MIYYFKKKNADYICNSTTSLMIVVPILLFACGEFFAILNTSEKIR